MFLCHKNFISCHIRLVHTIEFHNFAVNYDTRKKHLYEI